MAATASAARALLGCSHRAGGSALACAGVGVAARVGRSQARRTRTSSMTRPPKASGTCRRAAAVVSAAAARPIAYSAVSCIAARRPQPNVGCSSTWPRHRSPSRRRRRPVSPPHRIASHRIACRSLSAAAVARRSLRGARSTLPALLGVRGVFALRRVQVLSFRPPAGRGILALARAAEAVGGAAASAAAARAPLWFSKGTDWFASEGTSRLIGIWHRGDGSIR